MIKIYTGTPGSGKSLHSLWLIQKALKEGKNVICNFPVNIDKIKRRKGKYLFAQSSQITVKMLIAFARKYHEERKENQTVVVIDEASLKFNCRTYQDKDRIEFLSFFAQHRKYGYFIVLVCQNTRQLDRQIRDMIEIEVIHRKLNNFSIFRILPFSLFVAVDYNKAIKAKNEHQYIFYRKKIAELYNTFYDFTDEANQKEGELIVI